MLAVKSDIGKQNLLLPPSLDELVPGNYMVTDVDAVIYRLDISDILYLSWLKIVLSIHQ